MSYKSELYQQVILDHNKNPRNYRKIEDASSSCLGHNPLCGDRITVYLKIDEDNKISDISFSGEGCAISKSSASLMTTFVKGKSIEDVKVIFDEFHKMVIGELDTEKGGHHLGKLTIFEGVREYPARTKCATLAWHTLKCSIEKKGETTME